MKYLLRYRGYKSYVAKEVRSEGTVFPSDCTTSNVEKACKFELYEAVNLLRDGWIIEPYKDKKAVKTSLLELTEHEGYTVQFSNQKGDIMKIDIAGTEIHLEADQIEELKDFLNQL